MSDNEVILRVTTAALLVGFLIYKQWVRVRQRTRQRAELRRQFQFSGEVTAIDITPFRPRLDEVRRNYIPTTHAHDIHAREELVIAARSKLSHLSFFRIHPVEAEPEQRVG